MDQANDDNNTAAAQKLHDIRNYLENAVQEYAGKQDQCGAHARGKLAALLDVLDDMFGIEVSEESRFVFIETAEVESYVAERTFALHSSDVCR
jgi:hypothetical protein